MCVYVYSRLTQTPSPIPTKFGVTTIQNPATNISLEFLHFILNPEQRRVFQLVNNELEKIDKDVIVT
jgi:hypothetical protein